MPEARDDRQRRIYAPPADDDAPLDLVEQAIVRALVPVIVERIRAELQEESRRSRLVASDSSSS